MKNRRFGWLVVLSLAASALVGCGPKTTPTVRVTGVVTYNDKPIEGVGVAFQPQKGRPAEGTTDKDGRFTLSTFKKDDGAIAGTHKVVMVAKTPEDLESSPEAIEAAAAAPKPFPERYLSEDTSGFTAEVKKGDKNDFQFKMVD